MIRSRHPNQQAHENMHSTSYLRTKHNFMWHDQRRLMSLYTSIFEIQNQEGPGWHHNITLHWFQFNLSKGDRAFDCWIKKIPTFCLPDLYDRISVGYIFCVPPTLWIARICGEMAVDWWNAWSESLKPIPDICHESHENSRVISFWAV